MNHSIKNNVVVGALAGVVILPTWSFTAFSCLRISSFTVFKSSHYGIYYQAGSSVTMDSNILVDNQVNVIAKVIRPSILEHTVSGKVYNLKNSLIVGVTWSDFNR